jgi:glyoxylase-like metal-dependent hydrolase (beta-lactamase superfamily II)
MRFPFAVPPDPGRVIEIAEGMLWARLPLPFRLNHINLYLIEDDGGWALLDTGAHDPICAAGWEALFRGPLAGQRLTRIIVTHFHPDHVGLAGTLCERHGVPLLTTATCRKTVAMLLAEAGASTPERMQYYQRAGIRRDRVPSIHSEMAGYATSVAPLPSEIEILEDGSALEIGGRSFLVIYGNGHAKNQLTLYCPDARIFCSADQVIARITPNVSVGWSDSEADVLGAFLQTTRKLESTIQDDVLVAPGHELPFYGLSQRCRELILHHTERCRLILDACAAAEHSVADLIPLLFSRRLVPDQMSLALGETRAHVNFLVARGLLSFAPDEANVGRGRNLTIGDSLHSIITAMGKDE